MANWDWGLFFSAADPLEIHLAALLGFTLGALLTVPQQSIGRHLSPKHLIWTTGAGIVFFVPLMIVRADHGHVPLEVGFATMLLWLIFAALIYVGNHIAVIFWRNHG